MPAGEARSRDRPYPGLRPFGYNDRAFFFGREEQSYALYNLLDLSQFVAVAGGVGAVVRARREDVGTALMALAADQIRLPGAIGCEPAVDRGLSRS